MKRKRSNLLAFLLQEFFCSYLPNIRGLSPHTIWSYRDSLVLLLRFLASTKDKPVVSLDLEDMDPQSIQSFLIHLEQQRNNSTSTRNIRLAAIHTFFRFVAPQHPDRLAHIQRVLGIPFKRAPSRVIDYLEYDEIQQVLSAIDQSTAMGRRDYALLAVMFNSGARVQEILDLRAFDLQLTKPFQIRLTGKGRKQRCCPIWPQTAQVLKKLCKELRTDLKSDQKIFRNRRNEPLTRFGVRYILKKCLQTAQASTANINSKRIHPHSIRHSTAVALLKSGVDLSTISQWLGHSCLETTNRYATIDLEMKRNAIESIRPAKNQQTTAAPPWHADKTILEWLEAL